MCGGSHVGREVRPGSGVAAQPGQSTRGHPGARARTLGARFEHPDSSCSGGVIDCDLAVQKFGGGGNSTPVGRFEDDAGLLLRIDTTDIFDVVLSFDWRTFSASSQDELVVGYFEGDIPESVFGSDLTADLRGTTWAWSKWVELDRQGAHSTFTHEVFSLPEDAGPIWVAFGLDNGEGDYGKLDNVRVEGKAGSPVPEPSSASE